MMALEAKTMCEKEALDAKVYHEEMMRTQQRLHELCKMRDKISMGQNFAEMQMKEYFGKK
jgi:hypothetical protein